MAKSKKSNGSRAKKVSLKKIREELMPYFEEANRRASRLAATSSTKALVNAQASLTTAGKKHQKETGELFNVNAYHYAELQREFSRVKEFLNDETSINLSETEKRQLENKQKYGDYIDRRFYAIYGVNYDMSRLPEDQAKQLFAAYRRLEEANAPLLQGKSGYGSDNLINDLLEVMIEGKGDPQAKWFRGTDEAIISNMVSEGQKMLNQYKRDREIYGEREIETGDVDYGELEGFDNISREEFERRYNA